MARSRSPPRTARSRRSTSVAAADPAQTQKVLTEAVRQLTEFFAGDRREFALPLTPQGTPFRRRVWAAMQAIPYGETPELR